MSYDNAKTCDSVQYILLKWDTYKICKNVPLFLISHCPHPDLWCPKAHSAGLKKDCRPKGQPLWFLPGMRLRFMSPQVSRIFLFDTFWRWLQHPSLFYLFCRSISRALWAALERLKTLTEAHGADSTVFQFTSCTARQGRCLPAELEAARSKACMPRPVGREGRDAEEKCISLLYWHGQVANGWAAYSENCEISTQVWTRCGFRWIWEYISLTKNTNMLFVGLPSQWITWSVL